MSNPPTPDQLQTAAQNGDAQAQYALGLAYYNGDGIPQDKQKAAEWWTKAANQGHAEAQFNLGVMYNSGDGVPQDKEAALHWYQQAASQGNAKAQNNLGVIHDKGDGVPQNKDMAAQLFLKAADQGNADAQFNLALMHDNGDGVPPNKQKAAELYQQAAGQGHAKAQYNLALMHDNGDGIPQNKQKAVELYQQAADQGHADAQFNLALMHYHGDGIPPNKESAARWFQQAADQGHADAQFNLALMHDNGEGIPQNKQKAAELYQQAAAQGDADAQFNLALMHYRGDGIPPNKKAAARWFQKAAAQGHVPAQNNLADMHENDDGIPQNRDAAAHWRHHASEQGDAKAPTNLYAWKAPLARWLAFLFVGILLLNFFWEHLAALPQASVLPSAQFAARFFFVCALILTPIYLACLLPQAGNAFARIAFFAAKKQTRRHKLHPFWGKLDDLLRKFIPDANMDAEYLEETLDLLKDTIKGLADVIAFVEKRAYAIIPAAAALVSVFWQQRHIIPDDTHPLYWIYAIVYACGMASGALSILLAGFLLSSVNTGMAGAYPGELSQYWNDMQQNPPESPKEQVRFMRAKLLLPRYRQAILDSIQSLTDKTEKNALAMFFLLWSFVNFIYWAVLAQ